MPLTVTASMNIGNRIRLRVSNKKAYIWDVDDIATVRSKHNICGILTGTLPHLSQQNAFLGIPLLLMPEEAVLLVQKELAVIVDDPTAHPQPSIERLQAWNVEEHKSVKQQLALLEAKEAKEGSGRAMTEAAIQKRKEREEKRIRQAAKAAEAASLRDGPTALLLPPVERPHSPALPGSQFSQQGSAAFYTVTIPASSSSLEWYSPESCTYMSIDAARAAGVWDYPSTLHERAKCGVFQGLWEKGYFMGGGIKFGGDYLVYPGDPLRYHSHFVASVLESPIASLRPMEIVAHGRLGTATKKAHLLCGWDDDTREVSYLSVEWAGFG